MKDEVVIDIMSIHLIMRTPTEFLRECATKNIGIRDAHAHFALFVLIRELHDPLDALNAQIFRTDILSNM